MTITNSNGRANSYMIGRSSQLGKLTNVNSKKKNHFTSRAFNVCTRYPNYRVNIAGIGSAPEGEESVGECSQMACFVRRDLLNEPQFVAETDTTEPEVSPFPVEKFEYRLLFQNEFPISQDIRTNEEIIMDNVEYFFNRFIYKFDDEYYYNMDRDRYEFPLQQIYECVHEAPDYDELKRVVISKYCIEANDIVIVPVPNDEYSSSDCEGSDVEHNDIRNECKEANAGDDTW